MLEPGFSIRCQQRSHRRYCCDASLLDAVCEYEWRLVFNYINSRTDNLANRYYFRHFHHHRLHSGSGNSSSGNSNGSSGNHIYYCCGSFLTNNCDA